MQTDFAEEAGPGLELPPLLPNYYDVLQITPKAEPEVVEAAFRSLAMKYHPDRNPAPEATLRMQELNVAYSVLGNVEKRAEYDLARLYQAEVVDYDTAPAQTQPRPTEGANVSFEDGYNWNEIEYSPPPRKSNWLKFTVVLLALLLVGGVAFFLLAFNSPTVIPSTGPVRTPEIVLPANAIFADNFDSVAGANWQLEAGWHVTERLAASGKSSLALSDDATSQYPPNLDAGASLVRPLDLSLTANPMLVFKLRGHMAAGDRISIEIAEPGQPFKEAARFGGHIPDWQEQRVSLASWKGKLVNIKFHFVGGPTPSSPDFTGPFLDDIRVEK